MIAEIIPVQPKELVNIFESLLYTIDTNCTERLIDLVDQIEQLIKNDINNLSAFRLILAEYYQKQENYVSSIPMGEKLLNDDPGSSISIKTDNRR